MVETSAYRTKGASCIPMPYSNISCGSIPRRQASRNTPGRITHPCVPRVLPPLAQVLKRPLARALGPKSFFCELRAILRCFRQLRSMELSASALSTSCLYEHTDSPAVAASSLEKRCMGPNGLAAGAYSERNLGNLGLERCQG